MRARADTPSILAPPPLLFLGCLLAGWLLGHIRLFEPFDLSLTARLTIGLSLIFGALTLALSALIVMHRFNTPAEPWRPTERIVQSGPFRFSRNPIYVALVLALAGMAALTASGWLMLFCPVLFLLLRYGVIQGEERYLSQKFGETYLQYMKKVRRWI